jgi:hypothetical protein
MQSVNIISCEGEGMRYIVMLIVVVLSVSPVVHCAEPPELEEWFRITGDGQGPIGRIFSYLPDFEPSRGGTNATVVPVHGFVPTWYNRYRGDTVNQFTWSIFSGRGMRKADLNNDGADEYITRNGLVHAGIEQGKPPEADFINYNNYISSSTPFDFYYIDNDEFIDAIANSSYTSPTRLLKVLWGGPDLEKLKVSDVFKRIEGKRTETLVGILPQKSPEGKIRLVSRSYEESGFQQAKWISYVLREMRAIAEADSVRFELVTLDSISDAALRPQNFFGLFSGDIMQSRPEQPVLFYVPVLGDNVVAVYDLTNNSFQKIRQFVPWQTILYPHALQQSVNDDDYADYFLSVTGKVALYAGGRGTEIDTVPIAMFRHSCTVGEGLETLAIGDVTGDGIGDIATAYNNDMGCFVIYKGIGRRAVGVEEALPGVRQVRDFEMLQNYPNPVGESRSTVVPVQLTRSGHYTLELFSLDGKRIAELFSGNIPSGDHQIPVNIAPYELAAGMYVLRFSDGHQKRERGILLQ